MHEKLKDLGNVGSRTDVARISTEVEQKRDVNRILALLQSLLCTARVDIKILGL